MKNLVYLLLLLTVCYCREENGRCCERRNTISSRSHTVCITEFGAVGDGQTVNTHAFQNAIFYLNAFVDMGGAELYIPPGRWLTGSINLTSHMTLFLERDAVILGSQDYGHWGIVEPLPSYGRGIDLPGWRHSSLITGYNVTDVVITGNNGTIDGRGPMWWLMYDIRYLKYSRPQLLEFVGSSNIVIANLTFLNPPAWAVHPIYCNEVLIEHITVYAPPNSRYTSGIVPDSSVNVCIRYCNVTTSSDAIVLKSGWDEYGIAYAKPTANVHLNALRLQSFSGAGVAFGSEMSGGISGVLVEHIHVQDSLVGIELKTTRGRGGYLRDIFILRTDMQNVVVALKVSGHIGFHPDNGYDPNALPVVRSITFTDVSGTNITTAGNFSGIGESPFTWFILSNVTFHISPTEPLSSTVWFCKDIFGASKHVFPEPCRQLRILSVDTESFLVSSTAKQVAVQ